MNYSFVIMTGLAVCLLATGCKKTGELTMAASHSGAIRQALLVIDVQKDYLDPKCPIHVDIAQADSMLVVINQLVDKFKRSGRDVIFIVNEFDSSNYMVRWFAQGAGLKGTPGAALDPRLHRDESVIFSKNVGNAFSNPRLSDYLSSRQITDVVVTGLAAEACVYATVTGALRRKYAVTVVHDGVAAVKAFRRDLYLGRFEKDGARVVMSAELLR